MTFIFNTRNIFKNNGLLLTVFPKNTLEFKLPSTLNSYPCCNIIITRNIIWQHNALRRIAEKEERRRKLLKKNGQNMIEKSKVNKPKVFERSGIKTSKLKEMFNRKPILNKEKKENKELIKEHKQNKYEQDLSRQTQLHQTSRLNKRSFLLQMISRKCNPNFPNLSSTSSRKKRINPKEVSEMSESLLSDNNNEFINYDPNWRENENLPGWLRHRFAMKERIGFKYWKPHKRVNREIMDKIRWLHDRLPEEYDIKKLSTHFKISPESIRRILKSKFIPNSEISERQEKKYKEKLMKFKEEQKEEKKR